MNISVETQFNVGDKVWIKSQLDKYIDISTLMKPFLSFYIPQMLYVITNIKVVATAESGSESVVYDLEFVLDAASPYDATIKSAGKTDIEEGNLYSLSEGVIAIKNKTADFDSYLDTL